LADDLMSTVHKAGQRRHGSPSDQDAGDPDTSADLVHQQIAGNFEEEITDEEDPAKQSILLTADR
jgi:hypothetical protein